MTVLNIILNVILIRGLGPIPALGTAGAALGTAIASMTVAAYAIYHLFRGDTVIRFSRQMRWRADWVIIRSLFKFGLPTGVQGIAMNVAGVLLLRFVGSLQDSAAAQAAYAIGYGQLFSMITWTSVGLMGAAATIAGQNLGANQPERAIQGVHTAARLGITVAFVIGAIFIVMPHALLWVFDAHTGAVGRIGEELLRFLALSGFFITVALVYTGGLQGTGDTRSPLYITLASQIAIPIGICTVVQLMRPLQSTDIWIAIVLGHLARCVLSVARFRQGKWRHIKVEIEGARA
jgi:Na+-driven multidrug efflux pump